MIWATDRAEHGGGDGAGRAHDERHDDSVPIRFRHGFDGIGKGAATPVALIMQMTKAMKAMKGRDVDDDLVESITAGLIQDASNSPRRLGRFFQGAQRFASISSPSYGHFNRGLDFGGVTRFHIEGIVDSLSQMPRDKDDDEADQRMAPASAVMTSVP